MALPLPNEARTGGATAHRHTAQNLYNYYVAIAKLSKEIQRENNTINLYSLSELDRNGQLFMAETATLPLADKVRHSLEHRFKSYGVSWASHTAMETDFSTLRNTLILLNAAVDAMPEISDPATGVLYQVRGQDGALTENARTVNKATPPGNIENAVDLVANLFEAEGAP